MIAGVMVAGLALVPAAVAHAATAIDLGDATGYGVLAGSTVTSTGTTTITGDLGVSPGTAVTGFPPGLVSGATSTGSDQLALDAQAALTTAYNVTAGLTPSGPDVGDLTGLSLVPGVYNSDTSMSLTGTLTLVGSANSVWVFQAGTTLTTGTGSSIVLSGGASACNVFWQVGTSATLAGTYFAGTVMADQSITVNTGADIEGRLLARIGAVTLDTNDITVPSGCTQASSPVITSDAPTDASLGVPYSDTITSDATPTATYSITAGALPTGLVLDATSGEITGTPTATGVSTFTVTVSNGRTPDASAEYVIRVVEVPALAATGAATGPGIAGAVLVVALGLVLMLRRRSTNPIPLDAD